MKGHVRAAQRRVGPDELDGLVLLEAARPAIEQESKEARGLVGAGLLASQRVEGEPPEAHAKRADGVNPNAAWPGRCDRVVDGDQRRVRDG